MPGTPFALRYRLTAAGTFAWHDEAAGVRVRGSALKGAGRRQAADVALALGLPPCRQDGAEGCLLCRLFGAPGVEGALRWSDAAPEAGQAASELPAGWPAARARRPISRALGTAVAGAAIAEHAEAAGLALVGRIDGWLPWADAREQERAAALIVAALGLVRRVGGGQSDGGGAVRVAVTAIRLGETERDAASLLDALARLERS